MRQFSGPAAAPSILECTCFRMARPPSHNAAYYRRREREARALADAMSDAEVQKQMRNIAEEYTRLAEQAEAWERDHPKA